MFIQNKFVVENYFTEGNIYFWIPEQFSGKQLHILLWFENIKQTFIKF